MDQLFDYDLSRLLLSMAGSGNPWTAITSFRKGLLRALHDGRSLPEIVRGSGKSTDQIEKDLHSLAESSLLMKRGKRHLPSFFIADAAETQKVVDLASTFGRALANHLSTLWSKIETAYEELSVSSSNSSSDLGFLLVGAHILDIGLLEALKREGTLLRPAPTRPSPDRPQARYYFWMIEGDLSDLGRYGLDDTNLPWPGWCFLSFGQSWIDGMRNSERDAIEEICVDLVRSGIVDTPEALAKRLKAPLFTGTDTSVWADLVSECAESLVTVYLENERLLKKLFSTLRTSAYLPHNFSEFFCWYHHVSYAWAIDALEAKGLINIPPKRFTAALWYAADPIYGVL